MHLMIRSALIYGSLVLLLSHGGARASEERTASAAAPEAKSIQSINPAFPPALLYDGKPVDPMCFINQLSMEGETESIDLRPENCLPNGYKDLEYFSTDPYNTALSYQYAEDDFNGGMSKPYLMVQYAGPALENTDDPIRHPAMDADVPVIIRSSGGGTGQFSTLYKMRRFDENHLQIVETLSGGDRCNSGINEAYLDADGRLNYSLNLTPYTMVLLGGKEDREFMSSIAPYDDLDDCAACCYGQVWYNETDITAVQINENLREFIGHREYSDEARAAREKQICFDDLVALQLQSGHTRFNPDEWHLFIREVEHTCLGRLEGE